MYHCRFKGSHYEAGFKFGSAIKKHGVVLNTCPTFPIDENRIAFGKECVREIERFYPEIVDEVRGLAAGNGVAFDFLASLVFTMYCYDIGTHCSCFAYSNDNLCMFGRNSDFLVSMEKLYLNVLYNLDNAYSFNGNTTAFIEMEDGVNEYGLAVGLTFIPVKKVKPGMNVGILTRYLLEKCTIVEEALAKLELLPIAGGGTLTLADRTGTMAGIELSSDEMNVILPHHGYICTSNVFSSEQMRKYSIPDFDNWRAEERLDTMKKTLESQDHTEELAPALLGGKYGFMCQYDRKKNADTVWSVVYDLKKGRIFRTEGNPGKRASKQDTRFTFTYPK